jgi:hypothetical protein
MKQCPKCSSTYANNKQKFCTKDGTALVDAHEASAGQDATIRIDSTQLDDEITKVISQPLPRMTGSAFDPYKTQVSKSEEQTGPPPAPSQPIAPSPAVSAPPPAASAPPPAASAPPPAASAPPPPASAPPPPASAPPVPPPTTANIGSAQATNASISADTAASVPVSRSSQLAATIAASAPPIVAPAPPVQPAKKRSKLPLIFGILFVLFLIGSAGAVAGYFFVVKPMLDKKRVAVLEPQRPEPTPMVASTPDIVNPKPETPKIEVPPYSPPADAVQFVNSNAKLDGKLAEHYVDFSFYYPKTWQKDPKAGVAGASNFAKVERRLPPDFTQENFAVGWYSSTGSEDGDRVIFPTLADNLSKQFAKAPAFSEYKKVSEGPTKVGVYDGYEFRFESASRNTEHGDIKIWGRVIFVAPTDGSNNGVTLLMLTTSLAPELKSVDDVGVRGELPMVLESFRFGK